MFTEGTEHEGFSFFFFISNERKVEKERSDTAPLIPKPAQDFRC